MRAQGNALGTRICTASQALKGQHNLLPSTAVVAPLQGLRYLLVLIPRALPWADIYEPFRLEKTI